MLVQKEEIFFINSSKESNKTLIYAPLRSFLGLISKDTKNQIEKGNKNTIERVFSRFSSKKKIDIEKALKEIHSSTPELTIALTDNCNLKCLYCHASAGDDHKKGEMTKEMVNKVIYKYFEQLPKDTKQITINIAGGGEPTYNFVLLKHMVKLCRKLATIIKVKNVYFTMATNGYYGDEIREFLTKEIDNLSLSLDGIETVQNLHRPTRNGKDSFKIVFKSAQYFYRNKANLAFRITVSDYSLKYLFEIADFFIENFPGSSVGIEYLTPNGRAKKCTTLGPPNKKEFSEKLIELLDYAKDKPIKISNSASSEFNNIRPVFCSSVGIPNWNVAVNGEIYCCTRDEMPEIFKFGKFDLISGEVDIYKNQVDEIRKMSVVNYPECQDCFCKYHCAGDCPDRRISDKVNCESIRNIGAYILNQKMYT